MNSEGGYFRREESRGWSLGIGMSGLVLQRWRHVRAVGETHSGQTRGGFEFWGKNAGLTPRAEASESGQPVFILCSYIPFMSQSPLQSGEALRGALADRNVSGADTSLLARVPCACPSAPLWCPWKCSRWCSYKVAGPSYSRSWRRELVSGLICE